MGFNVWSLVIETFLAKLALALVGSFVEANCLGFN